MIIFLACLFQRVYCVLWGTILMDFENEEESKTSLSPKCLLEVIGVSKWDGQGRSANHPNGFLGKYVQFLSINALTLNV
jgi:hypothetical protein